MKSSELKQLIKEEIVSILSENQDMRGIIDEFSKEFNIPAYALRYFDYGSDGSGEFVNALIPGATVHCYFESGFWMQCRLRSVDDLRPVGLS